MYISKDNDFPKGNNWYDIKFLLYKNNHGYELRNFRNYNLLSKQIAELSDVKMYISGYILMNKKYTQYNTLHVG